MKAEVIAEPYCALPCRLQTFTINGIKANMDEFGEDYDDDVYSAPDYGCGCHKFEADRTEKPSILEKYNIDYADYLEICDLLEKVLFVGWCEWCT